MSYGIQAEFKVDQAWNALVALLTAQLVKVDVQALADKDFDNNGELVMNPPSVRIFYAGTVATSTSDTQRLSYEAVHRFNVLCADQDYTNSGAQALASAKLSSVVLPILAGTRLILADGDLSAPLTWVETVAQPVAGINGVAYGLNFEVPGLAQFPGANANPTGGV